MPIGRSEQDFSRQEMYKSQMGINNPTAENINKVNEDTKEKKKNLLEKMKNMIFKQKKEPTIGEWTNPTARTEGTPNDPENKDINKAA